MQPVSTALRIVALLLTRQYAAECLRTAGEAETFRARQLAWVVGLAGSLGRLTPEHENIRTALQTAEYTQAADSMLQLRGALQQFWNAGSLSEGRSWLQRAPRLDADHAGLPG